MFKAHGYSDNVGLGILWLPDLSGHHHIHVLLLNMFYAMRTRMMHASNEPDNRSRQFLTIAILYLLGFIVCAAPLAVLDVADLVTNIDPGHFKKIEPIFKTFLILNPLVVGFLIVYRGKFRQRRRSRNIELRTVHKRRERSGEVQVWQNPVAPEGLSRIAVVTGAVQG